MSTTASVVDLTSFPDVAWANQDKQQGRTHVHVVKCKKPPAPWRAPAAFFFIKLIKMTPPNVPAANGLRAYGGIPPPPAEMEKIGKTRRPHKHKHK